MDSAKLLSPFPNVSICSPKEPNLTSPANHCTTPPVRGIFLAMSAKYTPACDAANTESGSSPDVVSAKFIRPVPKDFN